MTYQEIWDDFLKTVCIVDGKKKVSQQSFCRGCYRKLPSDMRQALWRRFGEGYEAAFEMAKTYLTEE